MARRKRLRLEYRDAKDLADNPRNWRRHPARQTQSLEEMIKRVGWAGAALYNERTGRLIDGHLRKKIAGSKGKIPVLIGSWSEEEEALILSTFDPITALAQTDEKALKALLDSVDAEGEGEVLKDLLLSLREQTVVPDYSEDDPEGQPRLDGPSPIVCPECGHVFKR